MTDYHIWYLSFKICDYSFSLWRIIKNKPMNKVNYIHELACRELSLWKKQSTELVFGSLPLKLHIHTDFYCLMVNRKAISFLSLVSFCQLSLFIKFLTTDSEQLWLKYSARLYEKLLILWKSITKGYTSKEKIFKKWNTPKVQYI